MKKRFLWPAVSVILGSILGTVGGAQPITAHMPGPYNTAVAEEEYAQIWYVSQASGSDSLGKGSKTNPWQSIERAVTQAEDVSADRRCAIFVANGTYPCNELMMCEYVDIYGGFDPTGWERDIFRHPTILDGGGRRRILIGADHARLDGFIVRRGSVRGRGAAMLCDGTSPTVTNNRFLNNKTKKPKDWNPIHLHEIAHDGGAVCCLSGAKPAITHNLFANNQTEIGRGAAIALHGRCAGEISHNVFLDNETGTVDKHRSSDGGAVSIFDWSKPRIENNVFIGNKSLATNDGGAVFVALWSSPAIIGNTFVGNQCTDDGGALFVGGREHRYDRPPDPMPAAEEFSIAVSRNLFWGNTNPSRNSGGIRVTMQARTVLVNNILSENDQLSLELSDVVVANNTLLEDVAFQEFTAELAPRVVTNNIFWGNLKLKAETSITFCNVRDGVPGQGNLSTPPLFVEDQQQFKVAAAEFDANEFATVIVPSASDTANDSLAGRVVKAGNRWSTVKSNDDDRIVVWGDLSDVVELSMSPTYRLQAQSPCIDQGTAQDAPSIDFQGDQRPFGKGFDIGADEFVPQPRTGRSPALRRAHY